MGLGCVGGMSPAPLALWGNSNFHGKVVVLLSVLLLLQNVAADVLLYTYFSKCTFFKANFS